jgi:hypothetical protein
MLEYPIPGKWIIIHQAISVNITIMSKKEAHVRGVFSRLSSSKLAIAVMHKATQSCEPVTHSHLNRTDVSANYLKVRPDFGPETQYGRLFKTQRRCLLEDRYKCMKYIVQLRKLSLTSYRWEIFFAEEQADNHL